jgi:hypothetical protein
MNSMSRKIFAAALPLVAVGHASAAHSQGNPPENDAGATLFENVRIFDGKGASLSAPSNVLIKGNIIERISTEPIAAESGVTVIAGNGRTLMPGLIDAHWHAMLIRPNPAQAIVGDVVWQAVGGVCGGSPGDRSRLICLVEGVSGTPITEARNATTASPRLVNLCAAGSSLRMRVPPSDCQGRLGLLSDMTAMPVHWLILILCFS